VLPSVVKAFGAALGTIALFHSPSTLRLSGLVGLDRTSQLARTWEEFDVGAGVPLAETARTGEPVEGGDTGATLVTSENIDDEEVQSVLDPSCDNPPTEPPEG